ncbi:transcriptional regulator with PAS, ATPase and Fis domain [Sedimentibacter acidaminivorans]|uniref:Transcriptional regulator with PAS, ATPase and Fis domain n=1 Tax=Sedimentibacter acidaminivorans TaxID=913099 RepID=A0ABS4G9W8_9FIRM|nr:sigma 54-interacting transcriptional regulator [Sedimentibacter acidaminivorans]MBP1924469.1 transcriptional regulator with PAS, ATPase and Fis domain [Sedimentibacter acidaminivorans]
MFETDSYVKKFTDMMSEGFIFIDNKGKIQIYNNKAKEIFGISYNYDVSHNSGKIEKGDIIVIGDNCIGKDDANLTPEALSCIGIFDNKIQSGDAIVAVGIFGGNEVPVYEYIKPDYDSVKLKLDCNYANEDIKCSIDFKDRVINIQVNKEEYLLRYINCFGHIVVLDGKTKKMKFYQTHGYTARGEGIFDLLKGKEFRAKGETSDFFNVIGKDIFEIHKGNITAQEFFDAATGKNISYVNEFKEINGRPTICTLSPVNKNGVRVGAALKVDDISEVKKVIRERDEALYNLEQMERKLSEELDIRKLLPEIVGESKEITNVMKLAIKATRTNSTVLILGESGTGKSILAKAIHDNSKNKDNPFIHVNCGSIPETLLESELFGYEGGAFTGAKVVGKVGLFELAQGGTIFLDEIGEISTFLQVKLLQVLQDRTFYKVGGNKSIKVDVRIIAATNKNLEKEILLGNFREDLYYRINVFPIWIPPLRDRKSDIYPLVRNTLPKICTRIGCEEKRISVEAISVLTDYNWPGNVRELENILERAINLTEGNIIMSTHLAISKSNDEEINKKEEIKPLKDSICDVEKKAIEEAIIYSHGDKKLAMNLLKISKTSFYEKLKKYNLSK